MAEIHQLFWLETIPNPIVGLDFISLVNVIYDQVAAMKLQPCFL